MNANSWKGRSIERDTERERCDFLLKFTHSQSHSRSTIAPYGYNMNTRYYMSWILLCGNHTSHLWRLTSHL